MSKMRTFEWRHIGAKDDEWSEVQDDDVLGDGYFAAVKCADALDNEGRRHAIKGTSIDFEMRDDKGIITVWSAWGELTPRYFPHMTESARVAEMPALKPIDVAALRAAMAATKPRPAGAALSPGKMEADTVDWAAEIAAAEEQGFRKGVVAGVRVGWTNARTDLVKHVQNYIGSFPTLPSASLMDAMIEVAADGGAAAWAPREKQAPSPASPRPKKVAQFRSEPQREK